MRKTDKDADRKDVQKDSIAVKKVLVICGATATGKTAFAVKCAKMLESQVISADSQLIYRHLNIGTAKPTAEEMEGVVHHMIDIVEPDASFSVSDYREKALPIVEGLLSEGKVPVICGGTGFYINSLLFDLSYGSARGDEGIRAKYNEILRANGKDYLYNLLKEVDEQSALTIHLNDTKRVIRALEIYEVSGKRKSELNDGFTPKFNYIAVAINYPREELYARIDERVDVMFESGLVDEVKSLLSQGIDEHCQSMQAIGYKEVIECLKNGDLQSTMRDIIKRNTRHYAKRQITFFKKLPNTIWLEKCDAVPEKIMELLND